MAKKRFIILFFGLAAIVVAGWWFFKSRGNDAQDAAGQPVTVVQGSIEQVVTAQGKLEPKEYVDVGAQVSGQLEVLHVELGDVVKQGDLIAEIDPKIYQTQVQADEARLKTLSAQRAEKSASVVQAQQKLNRNAQLLKADAISKEVFQDAQTALTVAKAQLASLDAQIEEGQSTLEGNKTNLNYAKIYAPMAGTVVSQSVQEGQTLNANQTTPTIVQLANLDLMTVRAQVAEADILNIKPGMQSYFTVLGSQNRKWTGTVRQVLPTPEVINDVVLYNVLVDVENKDRQLMINMSTQMFFKVAEASNVSLIPVSALGKRVEEKDTEKGEAYMVQVAKGAVAEDRLVHIGLMDRTNAQVVDGLSVGDQVLDITKAASPSDPAATAGGRRKMPMRL